jgi:hypothetical protein
LASASYGKSCCLAIRLSHAKLLPKCGCGGTNGGSYELQRIEACEIALSTMLPEPASAGRHACHSVVMASLTSEGTERAAGRHSIVAISSQLIDEIAHERLISGDIHLMRVAANVTARSAVCALSLCLARSTATEIHTEFLIAKAFPGFSARKPAIRILAPCSSCFS